MLLKGHSYVAMEILSSKTSKLIFLVLSAYNAQIRTSYEQQPMFSVHVTTNIVSSNSAHDEVYSIRYYMIKFVSDLRQVDPLVVNSNNGLY
jgi:hypothetical protein